MPRTTTTEVDFADLASLRTWLSPVVNAARQNSVALNVQILGDILPEFTTTPEVWRVRLTGPVAFLAQVPDPAP